MAKPHIAVFSGATATISNSPQLVTSNKARAKYGLPPRTHPDGSSMMFDPLRAQRLARPVTVYIEQYSAHPLERDAADLYAPPDGYIDDKGDFHKARQSDSDIPVYEVTLNPEDGYYPLPYMARQTNGTAWEDDASEMFASPDRCRQPFYPDASRIFEEIDRFGIGLAGIGNLLSAQATFDFYRAVPPGGYSKGLPAHMRTDVGEGDIPPEKIGVDFFPYRPFWHFYQAPRVALAKATNVVQKAMASGKYAGGVWIEGSTNMEETIYWLNLLIDTTVPIVGNSSQHPHGGMGNDGDGNIVDAVDYIVSRVWADERGRNRAGMVAIQNKQIFSARDIQKGDARPGGYVVTGGHGGIIGRVGELAPPAPTTLTYVSVRRHSHNSAVNLSNLPSAVMGITRGASGIVPVKVDIKDSKGALLPTAIPKVTIVKESYQYAGDLAPLDPSGEVDVLARMERNLERAPLAGFIGEGLAPYGFMNQDMDNTLRQVVFTGMPVVKVARGNAEGFVAHIPPFISGGNLSATKARLLLMACLMKFGHLPIAANPKKPTHAEFEATMAKVKEYQTIFDTH